MNVTTSLLSQEISKAFPKIEMPNSKKLMFYNENYIEVDELSEDLQSFKDKEVTVEIINLLSRNLSLLSGDGWLWIFPYYLQYCLTDEANLNQTEIEYLIYLLSPTVEFESKMLTRFLIFSTEQVNCIISFLKWLLLTDIGQEYFKEDIYRAIALLTKISR